MEYALGNIFVRPMIGKAGEVIGGHTHTFDHVTYCVSGEVLIERRFLVKQEDGTHKEVPTTVKLSAGDFVLIEAPVEHKITGITDFVAHCIYAHRVPQGDVVQKYTGWPDSYR